MNIIENIDLLKTKTISAVERWSEHLIDDFATRLNIVPLSPYMKRGVKNFVSRHGDKISDMLRSAAMFVTDENGECDLKTVTEDFLNMIKTMKPVPIPFLNGQIGEGKIKFCLPSIPFLNHMLGGVTELTITEKDLSEFRRILLEELA